MEHHQQRGQLLHRAQNTNRRPARTDPHGPQPFDGSRLKNEHRDFTDPAAHGSLHRTRVDSRPGNGPDHAVASDQLHNDQRSDSSRRAISTDGSQAQRRNPDRKRIEQ